MIDIIREYIKTNEGFSSKLYKCTAGYFTIGFGRNLQSNGITKAEADFLFETDYNVALANAGRAIKAFDKLNTARQSAIVDMIFNLGLSRFLLFKKFIEAIEKLDFNTAAEELKNSTYYKQVGTRGIKNYNLIKNGE